MAATQEEIRRDLSGIVRFGVECAWIHEAGSGLLELACVRVRIRDRSDAHADCKAVVEVLREARSKVAGPYGVLLGIVLGLDDPTHLEMSIADRRELAGQTFRHGKRPVKGGTIRTYHERKALDQLSHVLADMEGRASRPTLFEGE